MKRILTALMLLMLLLFGCAAAEEVPFWAYKSSEGFRYYVQEDGTAVIAGFSDLKMRAHKTIALPAELDGFTVVRAEGLDSTNLRTLEVPSTIVSLNVDDLRQLDQVVIDPANPALVFENGMLINRHEQRLVALVLERKQKEFEIPAEVHTINQTALDDLANLNVLTVAEGHPSLTVVDGMLIDTQEQCLLMALDDQTGVFVVPEGVREIGPMAFNACGEASGIELPDSLVKIGERAFWGCDRVKELHIPAGVQEIGLYAFGSMEALEVLTLPGSWTGFTPEDFDQLKKLREFRTTPGDALLARDGVLFDGTGDTLLAYPSGREDMFYAVPAGTKALDRHTFRYNTALQLVSFPDSLTTIGDFAFYGSKLTAVSIPGSVRTVGAGAFSACMELKIVVLEEGVERVYSGAFASPEMTLTAIPASVTYIEYPAFDYAGFKQREPADAAQMRKIFDYCLLVKPGSEAERYALEYGLPCRVEP